MGRKDGGRAKSLDAMGTKQTTLPPELHTFTITYLPNAGLVNSEVR